VNEKAFRLDFFIAIAALLISALTAGALVYQTRVIADQYAATIWPYMSVNSTYSVHGVAIQVENDGVGPALIESAQLLIDGKAVPSWGTFLYELKAIPALKGKTVSISASSFGRADTVRPGDTKSLFTIAYKATVERQAITAHTIGIRLCYCSINSSCWTIFATPGNDSSRIPQPVSTCTGTGIISSDLTYPSSPPRRK
jgi:hypothetical protein